ncbi:MAG: copper chaperone PCu(A)C [Bradyrhizobiaceae bacterium]|nr:MAG: copper chaperone PCu(A)C [Bradyrhizobiaceae bacterium]
MRYSANAIVAVFLVLALGVEVHAQTSAAGGVVIEQPWARATPGGAKTGAAYMTVKNSGVSPDRLVSATTSVADKVQFHEERGENGVSRMQEVASVNAEPGAQIVFKPGGMHMMMVGLKQPLKEGQTFQMTLQFEKAGSIAVAVPVGKVGAMEHGNMGSKEHDHTMKK